jgi:hypothetical protein
MYCNNGDAMDRQSALCYKIIVPTLNNNPPAACVAPAVDIVFDSEAHLEGFLNIFFSGYLIL